MTDEQIERLAARVIERLTPPVLVMVTAAEGYRTEIRQRLAGCGYPLRIAAEAGLADAAAWQEAGELLPPGPGRIPCPRPPGGPCWCRFSTIRWPPACWTAP
ncbi:Uncharacterised protein [Shimwellia blattae]|nr:hypothetical protein [Shimwellia blattae]VDY63344.1 Uncharacterised protein [Shimwellia blattae]